MGDNILLTSYLPKTNTLWSLQTHPMKSWGEAARFLGQKKPRSWLQKVKLDFHCILMQDLTDLFNIFYFLWLFRNLCCLVVLWHLPWEWMDLSSNFNEACRQWRIHDFISRALGARASLTIVSEQPPPMYLLQALRQFEGAESPSPLPCIHFCM